MMRGRVDTRAIARRGAVVGGVALAAALWGCAAVLGLGGLSDATGDAGVVDATKDDRSAQAPDAPRTVVSHDAPDVHATPHDAGMGLCFHGNTHAICDDFDDIDAASGLGAKWTTVVSNAGGSVRIESDASVSPPNALSMEVDPLDGGSAIEGLATSKPAAATTSGVHCELDLLVDHVDPGGGGFYIAGTAVTGAGGDPVTFSGINLALVGESSSASVLLGGEVLYTNGSASPSQSLGGVPTGQWMHATLQLQWSQDAGATATALVDFKNGRSSSATFPQDAPHTVNSAQFAIGYTQGTLSTSAGWLYYVDNYFCDVLP